MKVYFFFFLFSCYSFSQPLKVEEKKINIDSLLQTDEYIGIEILKHTVKKGERMKNIYMKYKITPGEIYRLNPEAKDSLKAGSTLLIPLEKKVVYREWLNPNWVKQNEEKLRKERFFKDSINTLNRTNKARLAIQEEDALKNKKKKSVKKEHKETKITSLNKEKPIFKDTIKSITKIENTKIEIIPIVENKLDTISNKNIVINDDLNDGKGKKSKKKKKKEEIKYGSPDDHDVFLDAKNKENYILHDIEEGETLAMIAKRYKVPDYALLEFNKKVDFYKVPAGNLMKIPNIEKENVQNYIYDLIAEYRRLNIKYDKEIVKKKFTYNYEEDEN